MLDVRAVAYLSPVAEQPIGPLTPSVSVISFGDEAALITGLFRIYRKSTDQLLYTSEILPTTLAGHATAALSALTPWNPPAPADDDFFVLFGFHAVNDLVPDGIRETLGAFIFDIKTVPMGPVPAGHHTTHERAGMDPVLVEDLGTAEPAATKFLGNDGAGGLEWKTPSVGAAAVETLTTTENDTALRLAPDGAGGVEWSTGGGGGGSGLSEQPQTLTDQANIDWDQSLGGAAQVTLGGDRTMNAPTNMVNGSRPRLKVIQDGTGTRLLTWNACFRFPGGIKPTLSAGIGNIDIILFDCDGTHLDCTGMTSALA